MGWQAIALPSSTAQNHYYDVRTCNEGNFALIVTRSLTKIQISLEIGYACN